MARRRLPVQVTPFGEIPQVLIDPAHTRISDWVDPEETGLSAVYRAALSPVDLWVGRVLLARRRQREARAGWMAAHGPVDWHKLGRGLVR